eukprot:2745793-Amphidinium_carterae.1
MAIATSCQSSSQESPQLIFWLQRAAVIKPSCHQYGRSCQPAHVPCSLSQRCGWLHLAICLGVAASRQTAG